MSYNLLCKLFGHTFADANMWQLFYNLFRKLFGRTFASQICGNYCNSCSTSAGLWFACVRTEMPA